jgi:hypothetical protein
MNSEHLGLARFLGIALMVSISLLSLHCPAHGQATVGTGSIVGTVSDPSGAVISGAKVAITAIATQQVVHVATNSSGLVKTRFRLKALTLFAASL